MQTSDFKTSHILLSIKQLIANGVLDQFYKPTGGRVLVYEQTMMPVERIVAMDPDGLTLHITVADGFDCAVSATEASFFCVYQQ